MIVVQAVAASITRPAASPRITRCNVMSATSRQPTEPARPVSPPLVSCWSDVLKCRACRERASDPVLRQTDAPGAAGGLIRAVCADLAAELVAVHELTDDPVIAALHLQAVPNDAA